MNEKPKNKENLEIFDVNLNSINFMENNISITSLSLENS